MRLPIVIAAAGRGTRMGELTAHQPKHLLKVLDKPFLYYLLRSLAEAGAQDLFLVVGWKAELAYDFVRTPGLPKITVVNQFERMGQDNYGTLMPLLALTPELKGSPLLSVNGDNLYSPIDLAKVMAVIETSAVAGYHHNEPQRFGVLVPDTQTGCLHEILEKPAVPPSDLVNTGLYKLSSEIWDIAPRVEKSVRGEYELTQAVSELCVKQPIKIVELQDYWLDLGRPEDLVRAEELITKTAQKS